MTRRRHPERDRAGDGPRSWAPDPASACATGHATPAAGGAGQDVVDLDLDTTEQADQAAPAGGHAVGGGVLTVGQVEALPATVGLVEAGRALGIGRSSAYQLARDGQFPCPLIRVGALYRVPTAGLLRLLQLTPPPTASVPSVPWVSSGSSFERPVDG